GIVGEDLPGVGGVKVRLAPVPVGHPGDPDRPEHAGHAPAVPRLDAAVTDPRGARDPGSPLLAGGIDVERGLQQPPLQLASLGPDDLLPLPVIEVPGLVRRPRRQPGALLRGPGERRRPRRLLRLPGMISAYGPGNAPETRGPGNGRPSGPSPRQPVPATGDQRRSPSVTPGKSTKRRHAKFKAIN